MAKTLANILKVPYQDVVIDDDKKAMRPWQEFFRAIVSALDPLGFEQTFAVANNTAVAANITELSFNSQGASQAFVDFLIQRVTTGGGAVELIEAGTLVLIWKPTSLTWAIQSGGPATAGVTLTVTAAGQVKYTSSNITGTASISKITWRSRILAAKNSQYSKAGA